MVVSSICDSVNKNGKLKPYNFVYICFSTFFTFIFSIHFRQVKTMEGYLSKISIHINNSVLHANNCAVWSINILSLLFTCEFIPLSRAHMDVTTG